jgi:type III secretion system YscQ/HrcQ family protein
MEIKELPLSVTIELARLKTTLGELLKYAPGTTLELPITPEQNVTLTVNGEIVGKAELVSLGEHIGIRILEM